MGWIWKFPTSAKLKARQELKDTNQKRPVPWCEKRNVMGFTQISHGNAMRCLLNAYISYIDPLCLSITPCQLSLCFEKIVFLYLKHIGFVLHVVIRLIIGR